MGSLRTTHHALPLTAQSLPLLDLIMRDIMTFTISHTVVKKVIYKKPIGLSSLALTNLHLLQN